MIFNKIRSIYNKEGFRGFYTRLVKKVYIKVNVYKAEFNELDYKIGDEFKLIAVDLDILNNMYSEYKREITERKYKIIKERLKENSSEKAFIVSDKNKEIYGFYHIAYKESLDAGINYIVPNIPSNVHLFDDFTFENKRSKGAHKFSIGARMKLAKSQGYKTATVNIFNENKYSQNSYKHFGFAKIKEIKYYKFGKINKTYEINCK